VAARIEGITSAKVLCLGYLIPDADFELKSPWISCGVGTVRICASARASGKPS
jgi:hypothetical protein